MNSKIKKNLIFFFEKKNSENPYVLETKIQLFLEYSLIGYNAFENNAS